MKKQFVAIFLAALMLFGLSVPAMAAEGDATPSVTGRNYTDTNGKNGVIHISVINLSAEPMNITVKGKGPADQTFNAFDWRYDAARKSLTCDFEITLANKTEEYYWISIVGADKTEVVGNWVTFEAPVTPDTFVVTFDSDGGSEVKAQPVKDGEKATEPTPAPTKDGYTFVEWQLNGVKYDFNTPVTDDITLTAKWDEVPVEPGNPATITIVVGDKKETVEGVKTGDKYTLPEAPEVEDGKEFKGWKVNGKTYAAGAEIDITSETMTITAVIEDKKPVTPDGDKNPVAPVGPSSKPGTTDPGTTDPEQPGTDPTQPGAVSSIFTDVDGHWAVNNGAIQYVYDNGLMQGKGATAFAPNDTTTRAEIMVILARRAGVDTEGGSIWYQKGLDWMVSNNYSDGTNPNSAITRQELAALLYRVIGAPEVTGNLAAYPDASAVSDWAVNGMLWATQNGIITGTDTGALNPTGNATRAEVATILMRFCQQYPVQAPAAE